MNNRCLRGFMVVYLRNNNTHMKTIKIRRMSMSRMNLADIVSYFAKRNLNQTALYFAGCIHDNVTVDGWIEADFVRRHVGEGMMQELQCEVTTAVYA